MGDLRTQVRVFGRANGWLLSGLAGLDLPSLVGHLLKLSFVEMGTVGSLVCLEGLLAHVAHPGKAN